MNAGIYKITNPKGAIYIGQSINVDNRLNRYKKLQCCKYQHLLYRSFLKYGIENHNFDILVKGNFSKQELNTLENKYIIEFNSFRQKNELGLNLTSGGDSTQFSDEVKNKMSVSRKRKIAEGQRNSKIKIEDISEIKKLIAYNKPLKEIGDKFGVSKSAISEIKAHRSWADIPDYIVPEEEKHLINRTNKVSRLNKLTEDQKIEIIQRYKEGETPMYICKDYNVTPSAIGSIVRQFKKHNRY